ncbi:MAG: 2,4-dienoyl-CoA reductase [Conexibacter sp.]|nr:2,4-dienoyl-CoA reductase [Conexibacter sp.]
MAEGAPLEHVFAPGAIGRLRLAHRVVMGSMHLGTESAPDAGPALAAFYGERARAGAGLIVTGGWAVSRVGAGGRSYGFVNEDAGARALERVAATIRELRAGGGSDASIALQLFHAGRYAFEDAFGLVPVAPSVVPSRFSGATPRALSEDEVWSVIEDFARGARRAVELGFDAVELMGSEGYLVDQFLSPLTNRRDDAWGGDATRRMRFGLELARAVRAAVGDGFPVIFRLTGADLIPGSTAPDDVLAFAAALAATGVDALNVGIGWHESPVPTVQGVVPPGVWTPVAARLKAIVGPALPVIAGNRVNRLTDADALLGDGGIDFVSMARAFLADAELIAKARRVALGAGASARPVNVCIACNQACIDRSIGDGHVSCLVNPRAGFELEFPLREASSGERSVRRFAVVGGGPAGLEAARALAALGQRVELFEAADELGGQFRYARLVPGKEDFGATIAYFARELPRLGVTVHLGRPLTGDEGDAALLAGFDGVVLATGVLPRTIALAGAELPHVVDYAHAFSDGVGDARRVAIVGGGGIGVDLAHRLTHAATAEDAATRFRRTYRIGEAAPAAAGTGAANPLPQVTLMRRSGRIGAGMGRSTRWVWLDALRRAGVSTRTGLAYEAIVPEGVAIVPDNGDAELIPADAVVIAAGQERNDALRPLLERLGLPYRVVGGARDAAELNAVRAFGDGLRAAYELARG